MTFTDLPPLRDSLAAVGLVARKGLGQHFLLDLNLTRKIARISGAGAHDVVVEIGPGPGGLTRALLETGAQVIAIEKDSRFAPLLHALADRADGRLSVVQADALGLDPGRMRPGASVVANLPYNVGTPLLIGWLVGAWRPAIMTLMFQKEVADRLTAACGSRDYGRLSVLAQALCRVTLEMTIPARAFTPPPKVDSAVVRLVRCAGGPAEAQIGRLQRITAAAFGQRRKMLRSSLRPLGGAQLCATAGLSAELRAEDVGVAGYLALARALEDD